MSRGAGTSRPEPARPEPAGADRGELPRIRAAVRALAARIADDELRVRLLATAEAPHPSAAPTRTTLTAREVEVLTLVATGCANTEIARALATTGPAVKAQLRSAMRKLGTRSRHAAVSAARLAGLVA